MKTKFDSREPVNFQANVGPDGKPIELC
jgi:hypothetical protein